MATAASRITRLTDNNPRPVDEAALMEVLIDALDFSPGPAPASASSPAIAGRPEGRNRQPLTRRSGPR